MLKSMLTRPQALEILHEFTKSGSLRRHALQVEVCVAAYAVHFGQDETAWRVAALLHDFDYEIHPEAPDHPMKGEPILAGLGVPDEIRARSFRTPTTAVFRGIPCSRNPFLPATSSRDLFPPARL
jgi:predicted hydrolase (HD superfamily)